MSHNTEKKENGLNDILEKIKNNEIHVKTKTYFRLKLVALVFLIIALVTVSLFFSSLILFTIRASGHASLLGFGPGGLQVFLMLFPWKLFILALFLIIVLEWLLRSFRFGYKIPSLYLFGIVAVFMIISGFVIDNLHPHDRLIRLEGNHGVPRPFDHVYDDIKRPPPLPPGFGIFRGEIISVGTSTLQISLENDRGGSSSTTRLIVVILPENFSDQLPSLGDRVFVNGQLIDGVIKAVGVKSADHKR